MQEKITEGERIIKHVRERIEIESRTGVYPKMVFLPQDQWIAMYDFLLPYVENTYLKGHLVSEEALKEGYDNFMFQGVAICLTK